jgi:hypothetical protein
VIWNDLAMPRWAKRCWGRPVISSPSKKIFPSVGGKAPESTLKKVLLPAPFGPMIEVSRSEKKSTDTPCRAVKPPNFLPTPSARRMGAALMT